MTDNYKEIKEQFISNLSGGAMIEVFLVLLVVPMTALLDYLCSIYFKNRGGLGSRGLWSLRFLLDLLVRCAPILLSQTVLASHPLALHFILIIIAISLWLMMRGQGKLFPFISNEKVEELCCSTRKHFLAEYRAGMMLSTIIAILAVDFQIFPRRFAKTEIFGVSMMDLGVGGFVFSGALVSQAARNGQIAPNVADTRESSMRSRLWKMVVSNAPVFVLGAARFFTVRGVDYQVHVTEYGVHWNFFFTLAIVGIFVNLIDILGISNRRTSPKSFLVLAAAIALFQQFCLSFGGMYEFVMHAPRIDFISANKEGICTVLGYLSIYYFGVGIGKQVFSCKSKQDWRKLIITMTLCTLLLWAILTLFLERNYGIVFSKFRQDLDLMSLVENSDFVTRALLPSRRILNLGYIMWTIACNLGILLAFLLIDCCSSPVEGKTSSVSVVLHALGQNPLPSFLAANLLTGLVNLSMKTVFASSQIAMLVLCAYIFVSMSVSVALRGKRLL